MLSKWKENLIVRFFAPSYSLSPLMMRACYSINGCTVPPFFWCWCFIISLLHLFAVCSLFIVFVSFVLFSLWWCVCNVIEIIILYNFANVRMEITLKHLSFVLLVSLCVYGYKIFAISSCISQQCEHILAESCAGEFAVNWTT